MITVTKEFKFDCAHMLENHKGLCKNLHGHTYELQVTVAGNINVQKGHTEEGMLLDFKNLKEIVEDVIIRHYDHAMVLNKETQDEFEQALINLGNFHGKKMVLTNKRTTAENMAEDMFNDLYPVLEQFKMELYSIKLYEGPGSFVEVTL